MLDKVFALVCTNNFSSLVVIFFTFLLLLMWSVLSQPRPRDFKSTLHFKSQKNKKDSITPRKNIEKYERTSKEFFLVYLESFLKVSILMTASYLWRQGSHLV